MTSLCESASTSARAEWTENHISVCICTLRRPDLLLRTLAGLKNQQTGGRFSYSIVVADNDADRSSESVVSRFSISRSVDVKYCVEPRKNIALARNKAIEHADGDYVAFIDDDEFPVESWLSALFATCLETGADGVLGPVKPFFDFDPPSWVNKGKFFERPAHATGYQLNWEQSRSGNVLFKKKILENLGIPFREQFATAGEDMDFFRRAMDRGRRFVWCAEAVVYEVVPPERCSRRYLLRRALLRGSNFPKHPTRRIQNLAKSLVAAPSYALALPILLVFGQHVFLKYLIKLLDHVSRISAFLGLALVTERQT